MESAGMEDIDRVLEFARSIPDFPNKALVINRLETRNLNRYQEALLTLNEVLAGTEPGSTVHGQLTALAGRIARLEARDIVAE